MARENGQDSGCVEDSNGLHYGVWPFKHTYYWDNLEVGKWYDSACYVCDVQFSFNFNYPIGNVKLMLVKTTIDKGHIVAPVCSEQCHLSYKALLEIAK